MQFEKTTCLHMSGHHSPQASLFVTKVFIIRMPHCQARCANRHSQNLWSIDSQIQSGYTRQLMSNKWWMQPLKVLNTIAPCHTNHKSLASILVARRWLHSPLIEHLSLNPSRPNNFLTMEAFNQLSHFEMFLYMDVFEIF